MNRIGLQALRRMAAKRSRMADERSIFAGLMMMRSLDSVRVPFDKFDLSCAADRAVDAADALIASLDESDEIARKRRLEQQR